MNKIMLSLVNLNIFECDWLGYEMLYKFLSLLPINNKINQLIIHSVCSDKYQYCELKSNYNYIFRINS